MKPKNVVARLQRRQDDFERIPSKERDGMYKPGSFKKSCPKGSVIYGNRGR